MRRNIVFVSSLFFLASFVQAQNYLWSPDSLMMEDRNHAMNRYHELLRYHDPLMYLVFPVIKPLSGRKIPLEDGEGKNGYFMEGNLAYRFSVYRGKYYSPPAFQRLRFTLDADLASRVTRDRSAPLLPMNNKFGLGLDYLLNTPHAFTREKSTIAWITLQLHHYSNGQADSFFISGPVRRNNYISGDFSTNYFRALMRIAVISAQKSILSVAAGYQHDLDLGGPLKRSHELRRYYGDRRLLLHFQFTRRPTLVTLNYMNRATAEEEVVKVDVRRQIVYRTELEYILGDLSLFSGNDKYRLGWHHYLTYMPSVTNEVGFMLHIFLGRDYANIRFDDVVFIGAAGIMVRFSGR